MEAWQPFIAAQIVVSSFMTIWYRKVSLKTPQTYFIVALIVYFIIACSGFIISLASNGLKVPAMPKYDSILFIILAGTLIASSWVVNYKLLSNIGALSMSIASSLNFVLAALLGLFLLNERLSYLQVFGATLLIAAVVLSVYFAEYPNKKRKMVTHNFVLLIVGSALLACGFLFEKLSIDSTGVWTYVFYGWSMQFIAAIALFFIFGRTEAKYFKDKVLVGHSIKAGFLTVIAGFLFVYSLSQGLLSSVVLSASAKISLTGLLAIWILKERNHLGVRFLAFCIAVVGLLFMFI